MKSLLLSSTVALTTLIGATGAMAASGMATQNVNLRSGPSTAYGVAATIPRGNAVEINGCLANRAWCSVSYNGVSGWSAANLIHAKNAHHVPVISAETTQPVRYNSYKPMHDPATAIVRQDKTIGFDEAFPIVGSVVTLPVKVISYPFTAGNRSDRTVVEEQNVRVALPNRAVDHVNAYNPIMNDDVNDRNFERVETRYQVIDR